MKAQSTLDVSGKAKFHGAFTLIELIGVLAVLAILATFLVPALIRQMDKVAADQESASLKSLGDALQQSILRNRYVPTDTNWISTVATELGSNPSNVATNGRKQPRFFLVDPALQIGTNSGGLPYRQNNLGSVVTTGGAVVPPINPRLLILSSIGRALPAGIVSGTPSSADFNAIWDWNDAGSAVPTGATWTGWAGTSTDLKVQRINFSSLFVHLVLSTYSSPSNGLYSIDWIATNSVPTTTAGIEAYFIQNSILGLITHQAVLDSQQILIRDTSFVYNEGIWRGSIGGFTPVAGLDIGSVVDKFLAAPGNPAAGASTQQQVVQAMKDYMDAYEAWAASGFASGSLKTTASSAQSTMMTTVANLYGNAPEVACP